MTDPSSLPSLQPFNHPSDRPSNQPLRLPSRQPSGKPTGKPSSFINGPKYIQSSYRGSWTSINLPNNTQVDIVGAACSSSTNFVVIGNEGSNSRFSRIIRSMNGGINWKIVLTVDTKLTNQGVKLYGRLFDIAVYAESQIYLSVAETGQIYISSDNGLTWTEQTSLRASLYGVSIGSNGVAFAVGANSTFIALYVSSSSLSYKSWRKSSSPVSVSGQLNGVSSHDGVKAVAVGLVGLIYYTNNGGSNWTRSDSNLCSNVDLYSISISADNTAVAGGDSGCLIKSLDGGKSWSRMVNSSFASISFKYHSVSTLSGSVIYVTGINTVGTTGTIFRTFDGGVTWQADLIASNRFFTSIYMYDFQIGVAGAKYSAAFVRSPGPTRFPTSRPSSQPSSHPVVSPSKQPSSQPMTDPSSLPSLQPFNHPSDRPSNQPLRLPSRQPSALPS
jgi:photosystem II stability/assembly factor-like uncharacterized protein